MTYFMLYCLYADPYRTQLHVLHLYKFSIVVCRMKQRILSPVQCSWDTPSATSSSSSSIVGEKNQKNKEVELARAWYVKRADDFI